MRTQMPQHHKRPSSSVTRGTDEFYDRSSFDHHHEAPPMMAQASTNAVRTSFFGTPAGAANARNFVTEDDEDDLPPPPPALDSSFPSSDVVLPGLPGMRDPAARSGPSPHPAAPAPTPASAGTAGMRKKMRGVPLPQSGTRAQVGGNRADAPTSSRTEAHLLPHADGAGDSSRLLIGENEMVGATHGVSAEDIREPPTTESRLKDLFHFYCSPSSSGSASSSSSSMMNFQALLRMLDDLGIYKDIQEPGVMELVKSLQPPSGRYISWKDFQIVLDLVAAHKFGDLPVEIAVVELVDAMLTMWSRQEASRHPQPQGRSRNEMMTSVLDSSTASTRYHQQQHLPQKNDGSRPSPPPKHEAVGIDESSASLLIQEDGAAVQEGDDDDDEAALLREHYAKYRAASETAQAMSPGAATKKPAAQQQPQQHPSNSPDRKEAASQETAAVQIPPNQYLPSDIMSTTSALIAAFSGNDREVTRLLTSFNAGQFNGGGATPQASAPESHQRRLVGEQLATMAQFPVGACAPILHELADQLFGIRHHQKQQQRQHDAPSRFSSDAALPAAVDAATMERGVLNTTPAMAPLLVWVALCRCSAFVFPDSMPMAAEELAYTKMTMALEGSGLLELAMRSQ